MTKKKRSGAIPISDYDGTIFEPRGILPCDPAETFAELSNQQPQENFDAITLAKLYEDEVRAWLVSDESKQSSDSTYNLALDLLQHCQTVQTHAKGHGKQQENGLTLKLTPASLAGLGQLYLQFQVMKLGIERFAGIGRKQHPTKWNPGAEAPEEIIALIQDGITRSKLTEILREKGIGSGTARRWFEQYRKV